jgi:ABC-type antimicrobial peptide transport system permease subunit
MGDWRARALGAAELVGDALREIRAHPLRSLLTLSGIVFGAASLVAMTSLARAMKEMAYRDLESLGFPRSYVLWDRGPRQDAVTAADLRHPGLRLTDLAALRQVPGVEAVHGRNPGSEMIVAGSVDRRRVRVEGVDAGFLEMRRFPLAQGRSLRPLDVANVARVAVLGNELARDLLGPGNPVGRTITIDGVRFLVVGVVAPPTYEIAPVEFDWVGRRVYIPYSYLTRYQMGASRLSQVYVTVAPDAEFGTVLRRGETLVRQRHGGAADFEVNNEAADVQEDLAMADGILGGWNVVMYAIAGVTMVVGGIGLFSVLLISVRERVREIGIRKAVGADDGEIRRLFLAESLTLAFLGSVTGIAGGAGLIFVTELISRQFGRDFAIAVHPPGVVLAVVFALLVGLLFGWLPARRAARLDPIEAISGV